MKLWGKDFDPQDLLSRIAARLGQEPGKNGADERAEPTDPSVDPERFYADALDRHSDPREGLPLETHRTGLGRAVLVAKAAFRAGGKPFINELFERQRLFNSYVRDAIGLLFAEVRALKDEVKALREKGN